jgi:hypothetical protein
MHMALVGIFITKEPFILSFWKMKILDVKFHLNKFVAALVHHIMHQNSLDSDHALVTHKISGSW